MNYGLSYHLNPTDPVAKPAEVPNNSAAHRRPRRSPTGKHPATPSSASPAIRRTASRAAGAFLARLAGRSDQDVMTYMTIPSTISGGPSIFQVRMGTGEVLSAGDEADFLVAFYQHSYQDHISFLKEGGVLLYDSDNVEPNLDDKRFVYVGVPITGLTVEALGGTAKDKGKNIFVLGLIAKIFDLDVEKLDDADQGKVRRQRRKHREQRDHGLHRRLRLSGRQCSHARFTSSRTGDASPARRAQITMDGNTALAYGLIAAGVRYGAGYPITPWSSVMEILRTRAAEIRRHFSCRRRTSSAAVSMALGFSLFRPSRRHRQRGPGHFAEDRSDRLGVDGRDAAHYHQCAARRPEHRPADQRRAERSVPGDLRRPRRQPARRARRRKRSKIVSTSRSKPRGSRANTARRFLS